MHAERRHHEARMALGRLEHAVAVRPVLGHHERGRHARGPGALDHLAAVGVEVLGGEVAVRVEEGSAHAGELAGRALPRPA